MALVSPGVYIMHSLGMARNASALAREGDFLSIQEMYPQKILFADNEHRMLIINGGRSTSHLPTAIMYSLNYAISYDTQDNCFHILKNRGGMNYPLIALIRDLTGIQLHQKDQVVLTFADEADAVVAKLKGFICLK